MDRVTGAEVKEIFDTTLTEAELAPFILAATSSIGSRLDDTYTDAEIKEIERWYAAELASARDPRVSKEDVLGIKSEYVRDGGSPYWAMVKRLDWAGVLSPDDSAPVFWAE